MRLKSLEIQGFKSFANRVRLDFNDGITAIVGSNGTGKSNVADAIRWVLGEQSTKLLRGNNMQDVIFAGSETKKPLSYAYVCLTLDNSDKKLNIDYDEVAVARRIYRSGESEYLINDSVCRLKDVQELFYDTGIGKEGYSIIGQGQIDRVLSDKPEERRALFDEAVGIVKFKKNKAVALKKLEGKGNNLSILNDRLNEISNNLPKLKKQSEDAKKFLDLSNDLKSCDISLFLLNYDENTKKLKDINNSLHINNESLDELKLKLNKDKIEYDKINDNISKLEVDIDSNTSQSNELLISINNIEGSLKLIDNKRENLLLKDSEKEIRLSSLNKDKENKLSLIDENNNKIEVLNRESDTIDVSLKKISDKLNLLSNEEKDLATNQEKIKNDIQEIDSSIALIKNTIELSKDSVNEIEEGLINYTNKLDELLQNNIDLKNKANELLEDKKNIENNISLTSKTIDNLATEKNIKDDDYNRLIKRNEEVKALISSIDMKISFIKGTLDNYEGYNYSIKSLMKKWGDDKDVLGVVSDLIDVESSYSLAIEIALGAKIQNIVTKNNNKAKEMITYLKKNKLGRATFLPLDMLRSSNSYHNEDILKNTGVIDFAENLVKCQYDSLKKSLLNNILIVDNIDNAIKISKKYNQSIRIVTLDGESLGIGGSITGGEYKNKSNFLGRKNELTKLQDDLHKLGDEKNKNTSLLHDFKSECDRLSDDLEEKKSEKSDMMDKLSEIELKLGELEYRINDAEIKNKELVDLISSLKKKQSAMKNEDESGNEIIKDKTEVLESLKSELESSVARYDLIKNEIDEAMSEKNDLILKSELKKSEIVYAEENINRIRGELSDVDEEIKNISLINSEEELKLIDIEEVNLTTHLKNQKKKHDELLANIEFLSNERKKAKISQSEFLNKYDSLKSEELTLTKEDERLRGLIERITDEIEKSRLYIWNEYELNIDSARKIGINRALSIKELKSNIESIKDSIKGLGSINVAAIEDYEEQSSRYEFIKSQIDDIVVSENEIRAMIKKLDEEMKNQFKQEFDKINTNFNKIFGKLFNGGSANLTLADSTDLLETGININVQPSGKKLASMKVLSGGERALTAIALLFAIQSLKPSPFCLLDEIEAALDDTNVDRYARYLKNLTDNTQFILITHRKGTMAVANMLYGITMQEKGISIPISVSLKEGERLSGE